MIGAQFAAFVYAGEGTADAVSGMTLVDFLTSAGVGALICGVLVALINGVFSRGGKRADAAKALIEANKGFTDSVNAQYERLHRELMEVKMAVDELTQSVDEVLPLLGGDVHPDLKTRLREANRAAKLVS